MKEHPILFSGAMVRAILDGRKTQTRRLVGLSSFKPSETPGYAWTFRGRAPVRSVAQQLRHPRGCWQDLHHDALLKLCPYGAVGTKLWVRETWGLCTYTDPTDWCRYSVHGLTQNLLEHWKVEFRADGDSESALWRPSIHMPRWASRITLEVTEVRVERLQEITERDARAEGIDPGTSICDFAATPARDDFARLWDSINGARASWASNPWVWAISFRRVP